MADTKNTDRSAAVTSEEEERLTQDVMTEEEEVVGEAEEISDETEEAVEETDEVSDEAEEAVEETEEISDETEEAVEETDEVSDETEEAVEETDEVSDEAEEAVEETDEISDEEAEAVEKTDEISDEEEAVEEDDEPSNEEEAEAVEETDEPSEEEAEAVEETDEPSDEEAEAVEETDEPSDEEAEAVEETDKISDAAEEAAEETDEVSDGEEDEPSDEEDELYDDAVFLAQDNKDLTPHVLQRELCIGYARALRIFDQLKADGYVTSGEEAAEESDEDVVIVEDNDTNEISDEAEEVSDEEDDALSDKEDAKDAKDAEDYIDEYDYLDYEDDSARPKKIVSGRTAVITMLAAFLGAALAVVLAFLFATRFQRSTGVTFVSYTDGFNACRTNDFAYGNMLGIGAVSYSDADTTFSTDDIKALRSGKTVTKFDGLANISVKQRLGKVVSLDVKFSPELDKAANPSGLYALLAGNVISGLISGIESSDTGFMAAYTILSYSAPVDEEGKLFSYLSDDLNFCLDYTKAMDTQNISDITLHVESATPHYLEPSQIDTSWLPKLPEKENEPASSPAVSDTDVSPSDN